MRTPSHQQDGNNTTRVIMGLMHTSAIPITFDDGFRMQGAVHLKVFADTLQNVPRHHKLVTGINSNTGTDLVFLLTRHNFSVDTRNIDTSVKACLVHGVSDGTSKVVLL
jgi:hypothetical protein